MLKHAGFEQKINEIDEQKNILRFSYQTGAIIDVNSMRDYILHYYTVNVQINPSIIIPDTGVHIVKVNIDHIWYHAIASISQMIYDNDKRKKMVKLFIYHFDGTIENERATILWCDDIKHPRT